MRSHTSQLTILALGLTWGSGAAQNSTPARTDENTGAGVRLETHNGQANFKIGDPVVLDLVVTAKSPGYVVDTDPHPYLPTSDEVDVEPKVGWVQTHSVFRGQGQNGDVTTLRGDPIRVPVLLNRTITFEDPGHYEVTLTTERLRTSDTSTLMTSLETCEPCRTTNVVGIDLSTRDESEEAALVVSLSREIEQTRNAMSAGELTPEEKEELSRDFEAIRRLADSTEESKKQQEAILRKLNDGVAKQQAAIQKQEDARRDAAVRLAYLPGDDAVRAKVHFIVDDVDPNGGNPVGPIMRDGLPSSRNKQLQLTLLEAAWRDPHRVPTGGLHTALRQAKELMHQQLVNDDPFGGTDEERQKALEEYQTEINEIIATLPLRTESNRAQTIAFLKRLGVPNPFNQRQTTSPKPD